MAKTARVYKVKVRDGHGLKERYYTAQSKEALEATLDLPSSVKHMETKFIDHLPFTVQQDHETDTVEYKTQINGENIYFKKNPYLEQQFAKQTKKIEEEIASQYENDDDE